MKKTIENAIKDFEKTTEKYCDFGAMDGEVEHKIIYIIRKSINTNLNDKPESLNTKSMNADFWELYGISGRNRAANALSVRAIRIYQLILKATKNEIDAVADHYEFTYILD
jgi:hypothetical protein